MFLQREVTVSYDRHRICFLMRVKDDNISLGVIDGKWNWYD